MPIAFKEWAVTVRALAEGEQLVTLRKGGIREPEKHFALEHDRFFLYPTFDHQRGDLVRESHRPELRRALEEGVWADGEPPPHAVLRAGAIQQPDRVRIRAWAEVAAAWTVTDRRVVDGLSPFYVLLYYWSFRRLPGELLEAARLEGMQPFAMWRRLAMPLVRPVTIAIALLAFIVTWGNFLDPLVYLFYPDLYTLPLGLRSLSALDRTNYPVLLAGAVVATIPVVIAFAVAQRYFLHEDRGAGWLGR